MSLLALVATAGSLGLLGGLHCIAMCAGAQRVAIHGLGTRGAGVARPDGTQTLHFVAGSPGSPDARPSGASVGGVSVGGVSVGGASVAADLAFHAGRLTGYAVLGALIGAGSSVLRWGAEAAPLFRPLWGGVNAALFALGLALLIAGRQPAWLDAIGQRLWSVTGARLRGSALRHPAAVGAAWALLPCGLLYSALAVALLASDPLRGAITMVAFGAGTAVNLLGAQTLLRALVPRLPIPVADVESAGIRIGGAMLAAMAVAALAALALGLPHPFCSD